MHGTVARGEFAREATIEAVKTIGDTIVYEARWQGMSFPFCAQLVKTGQSMYEQFIVQGVMRPFTSAREAALVAASRTGVFDV